jgi:NitT/TauT family transport system substrate-binding protein
MRGTCGGQPIAYAQQLWSGGLQGNGATRQGVTIVMTSIRALQCLLTMAALAGAASPLNAQTAIRFSLDWKYEGTQSPFLVGVDKGYFK